MENQTEKKIKVLMTDNGGDLCKKEFEEFCKKCGIARQKTTPYTSAKWSCRKNEQNTDGKGEKHAQWYWFRTRILGRGSGDCMLLG